MADHPEDGRHSLVAFSIKEGGDVKSDPEVLSSVNSYLDADNPPEAILICFPLFNLVPCKHRVPLSVPAPVSPPCFLLVNGHENAKVGLLKSPRYPSSS